MQFIFISPVSWDNSSGGQRPVQFAQELARRGHAVTYLEIEKSRAPNATPNPRVVNLQELGWQELEIVRAWYGMDYTAPASTRLQARLPASEKGIVICSAPFRPVLAYVAELATQGYAIVYDALDDFSEMRALGSFCYDDIAEQYLARQADLVLTVSPRLTRKFCAQPNVRMINNGVDLVSFRRATDLRGFADGFHRKNLEGLELGFWGTMWDYNMDVPLLQTLTRARPQWQWHFIGAYDLDPARPSLPAALAAPNVHFHASVSRETLAEYAASFDVCILPTPVTPFNLARDPLKVYEYLACYKPVVATNLEQLADMPYVFLAHDANEFLTKIERAAATTIDRAALDAYLNEQTWAKRTDQLLQELEPLPHQSRELSATPRGAMPNAENELDRWQAFAHHLERMVQDREAHINDLENALQASTLANKLKRAAGLK